MLSKENETIISHISEEEMSLKDRLPNPSATFNSSSLTSSKKKLLKIFDEPAETVSPSNFVVDDKIQTYEERRSNNTCPYTNIEVVEGTLHSAQNGPPFTTWTIRVTLKDNRVHYCYKRYSEFVSLRNKLGRALRGSCLDDESLPELPKALPWYKCLTVHDYAANNTLDPEFLAKRQHGLEYFLCYVLLDQKLCAQYDTSIFAHWLNIQQKKVVVE
ncbi:hypothetical protein QEN19_002393 [Hanseniaspora menglaensis]